MPTITKDDIESFRAFAHRHAEGLSDDQIRELLMETAPRRRIHLSTAALSQAYFRLPAPVVELLKAYRDQHAPEALPAHLDRLPIIEGLTGPDPSEVAAVLSAAKPIKATLLGVETVPLDDPKEPALLVVPVDSPQLVEARQAIAQRAGHVQGSDEG